MASKIRHGVRKQDRKPGGARRGTVLRARDDYADVLDKLREPGAIDARDRMLEHGASLELTARVIRTIAGSTRWRGAHAIDGAALVLGRSFQVLPAPRRPAGATAPYLFAFVGPTGAGKSSTIAKLARKLRAGGRRLMLASLDAAGTTALERVGGLAADADRAELEIVGVQSAEDVERAARRRPRPDVVLLDTPGLSPRDERDIARLAELVEDADLGGPREVFLVLPATKSHAALELSCKAFSRLALTGAAITKVDETDEPAVAVETAARYGLDLALFADGIDTRAHLSRATPERVASVFLKGRLG